MSFTVTIPSEVVAAVVGALPFLVYFVARRVFAPRSWADVLSPVLIAGVTAIAAAACWVGIIVWWMMR